MMGRNRGYSVSGDVIVVVGFVIPPVIGVLLLNMRSARPKRKSVQSYNSSRSCTLQRRARLHFLVVTKRRTT